MKIMELFRLHHGQKVYEMEAYGTGLFTGLLASCDDEHSFDGAAMASGYITPDPRAPLRSLARFRGHGKEANVYFRIPLPKSGLVRGQKKKR